MGGISGFLLVFPGVIALTHEWTDFVRRLVAVLRVDGVGFPDNRSPLRSEPWSAIHHSTTRRNLSAT